MSKTDKSEFEVPDYENLLTLDAVDEEIEKHKAILVGKDITESRIKNDKKTYVAALNEQLKEIKEEREHEIDVLSALEQRKQYLANSPGGAVLIPMPKMKGN